MPRPAPPHHAKRFCHDGNVTYAGYVCVNKRSPYTPTFSFLSQTSTSHFQTHLPTLHYKTNNLHSNPFKHSKWTLLSESSQQDSYPRSITDALTRNYANSASDTASSTFNSASESLKGTADQASKEGNKRMSCNASVILYTPTNKQ